MDKILLLNGPNLNLLGKREPDVYGSTTLKQLEEKIVSLGESNDAEIVCFQSNHVFGCKLCTVKTERTV